MKPMIKTEWKKLIDVCEKPEYGYTTSAKAKGAGPKFVRTTDISDGEINWESVPYCKEPPKDEKRYKLSDGDILIARAGTIGASMLIKNPPRAIFASYLIRFRPKEKLDSAYAGFFLKSDMFFKQLQNEASGTTLSGVNATRLSNIKIPIIPLSSQRKIASVLEKCDLAIKKRRKSDGLSNKITASIFREMFGDSHNNFKGIEKQRIGEVADKCQRRDPSKQPDVTFKYVDIAGVNGDKGIIEANKEIMGCDAPSRARQVIHTNDVIISTVRPNLRATALVPEFLDDQICSTGFCVVRPSERINHHYLYAISRMEWFTSILVSKVRGASYPAVTDKDILEVEIPVPSISEQQRFTNIVQKFEKIKEKQQESKKELDNLFNALMQQTFYAR